MNPPRPLALACALVVLEVAAPAAAPAAAPPRPNFVFILMDDFGWTDLGSYGSTFYETPNLDRLAHEGARFSQAYAACPVCSPTRAAILTGKYPQRVAITDYISPPGSNQPEKWSRNTRLLPAPYRDRLPLEEVTIAEVLKEAGYATGYFGKWHLGPRGFYPEDQGFDVNRGGCEKGNTPHFSPYSLPTLADGPKDEYLADRLTDEAIEFIAANKERPFLAYLAHYDVHTPLASKPEVVEKYRKKAAALGATEAERWRRDRGVKDRRLQDHAVYAAMVELVDANVGRLLKKLDELGLAERTVVLFTSDNGGLSTSEGSPTSNAPLRAGKGLLYEGGIRVALLVRWPGVVAPGAVIDAVVTSPDFAPTILEIAGLETRPALHLDGASFVPALRGKPHRRGPVYWHYPHYGNQGGFPGSAVREGDWKLIERYEDSSLELYNLREDPVEAKDLAASEPERVRALHAQLKAWRESVGARMPSANPNFDPESAGKK
jgi:arylsulfatase A-like enzyme